MGIGENIKKLREKKGISQRGLAKTLNMNNATISQWERGISEPTANTKKDLINFFNVSEAELFLDSNNIKEKESLHPIPIFTIINNFFEIYFKNSNPKKISDEYMNYHTNDPDAFFIKISDNFITGNNIEKGDLLLIEPRSILENGDLCFCKENKNCCLKIYNKKKDGTIILSSLNRKNEPMIFKEKKIPLCYKISAKVTKF